MECTVRSLKCRSTVQCLDASPPPTQLKSLKLLRA